MRDKTSPAPGTRGRTPSEQGFGSSLWGLVSRLRSGFTLPSSGHPSACVLGWCIWRAFQTTAGENLGSSVPAGSGVSLLQSPWPVSWGSCQKEHSGRSRDTTGSLKPQLSKIFMCHEIVSLSFLLPSSEGMFSLTAGEGGRSIDVRETSTGCLPYVPGLGIEPQTFFGVQNDTPTEPPSQGMKNVGGLFPFKNVPASLRSGTQLLGPGLRRCCGSLEPSSTPHPTLTAGRSPHPPGQHPSSPFPSRASAWAQQARRGLISGLPRGHVRRA